MYVEAAVDLSTAGWVKSVTVEARSSQARSWCGKIIMGKSGEFPMQGGGDSILFNVERSIFSVPNIKFYLGGATLCDVVFPAFSRSYIVFDNKKFDFSFGDYISGKIELPIDLKLIRFLRGVAGSVYVSSSTMPENRLLAYGMASIYYELVSSVRS